jgi:glycosyltransferase involved in cell wall biosynthesis
MASASPTSNAAARPTSAETPVVSVVMPTYNGERFLRPAIESILNQTFSDFELIVVDDASTDSTPQILAELRDKDCRLIVITNDRNLGIAGGTNRALAAARGQYVALQDHDDISLPHRFQTQVDFLDSHPDIALVGSAATLIDENGVAYAEFPLPCEEIDIKWRLLFYGDAFHYTSTMVRRGALVEIEGYGEDPAFRFAEAYDPFSRLAMRYHVANMPETLVLWRRHPGATSLQRQQEQLRSGEVISLRNIDLLANQTRNRGRRDDTRYYLLGFKAFSSTPAGQLPTLPAEQVISGSEFLCAIQEAFYKVHRFPRSAVARHRRSSNYVWGKHAIALALRAPWGFFSRVRIFLLGIRYLWHAFAAAIIDSAAKLTGRATPQASPTVPTIRPIAGRPEQPA